MRRIVIVTDVCRTSPIWSSYAEHLAAAGNKVTLVSPAMTRVQESFIGLGASRKRNFTLVKLRCLRTDYKLDMSLPKIFRVLRRIYVQYRKGNPRYLLSHSGPSNQISRAVFEEFLERDFFGLKDGDILITVQDPFWCHQLGSLVAHSRKILWVADYRDAFSLNHQSPLDPSWREWETSIVSKANLVVAPSQHIADKMTTVYSGPKYVLHNGYEPLPKKFFFYLTHIYRVKKRSVIVYTGQIYEDFQDIEMFLRALDRFYSEKSRVGIPILLRVLGVGGHVVTNYYRNQGLDIPAYIEIVGIVSHKRTRRIQQRSTLLLFLNWCDSSEPGVTTTKLYEYLDAARPILRVGPAFPDEASKIFEECGGSLQLSSEESILDYLYSHDGSEAFAIPNIEKRLQYSRGQQTIQFLSRILEISY